MTGLPSNIKIELELTAGVWTDVTADVDASQAISWKIGRTSPFADPATATASVVFNNDITSTGVPGGRYTPGRQILADGVTVNPYWPNLDVRKRLRISYTIAATQYVRFQGYVKQWMPQLGPDGYQRQVVAQIADRLDQLSRVTLAQALVQEMMADNPTAMYLMNDAAPASGLPAARDQAGTSGPIGFNSSAYLTTALGAQLPVPVPDGLTGVMGTSAAISGDIVFGTGVLSPVAPVVRTFEAWITVPIGGATNANITAWIMDLSNPAFVEAGVQVVAGPTPQVLYFMGTASGALVSNPPNDGKPHHYAYTFTAGNVVTSYLDGVQQQTASGVAAYVAPVAGALQVIFGLVPAQPIGVVGPVAFYSTPLSAARIAAHYAAGIGNAGETTGARVARFLGYAGVAPAAMNIDPGQETQSGLQPVAGQTVLGLCQQVVSTEGGGSAIYQAPDGRIRFPDRTFRKPGAPSLTVDAGADLDPGQFAPSYDELTLINSSTVSRQGGSQQTFTDSTSEGKYNLTAEPPVTSYAQSDQAALNLAQWRVRSQCTPGLRLGQVTVDLLTATTANLYVALAVVQIGSRLRVTSLDPTVATASQLDVLVEGWTETVAIDQYTVVFDTSPADNPARGIADDPVYGRANPDPGAMTLQTGITAAGTTIKVATSSGPVYTTAPGAFPQTIIFEQEQITLNTPPSGSTSPQTFTGVTRGVNGTTPAAHAAGTVLHLYPAATATL